MAAPAIATDAPQAHDGIRELKAGLARILAHRDEATRKLPPALPGPPRQDFGRVTVPTE